VSTGVNLVLFSSHAVAYMRTGQHTDLLPGQLRYIRRAAAAGAHADGMPGTKGEAPTEEPPRTTSPATRTP